MAYSLLRSSKIRAKDLFTLIIFGTWIGIGNGVSTGAGIGNGFSLSSKKGTIIFL